MLKSQVLDKGFIEVVDSLGDDLTVVNSARVSFGKRKTKFDKSDEIVLPKTMLGMRYQVGMFLSLTFIIRVFGENRVMITNRQVKVYWMIYNRLE